MRNRLSSVYTQHVAATAKLLQSCLTLCDPIDCSPPGSAVPEILQARTLEWVASSFSNAGKWKVKVKSFSRVWLFETPWTAAYQAPPSMGSSRQEYWSGYTACWHQPKLKFIALVLRSRPYLYFFLYSDPTTLGFLLSFKHSHPHKFVSISACCTPCSLISPQIVLGLYTADSWLAKPTLIPKSFLPCLPPLQKLENYHCIPPPPPLPCPRVP